MKILGSILFVCVVWLAVLAIVHRDELAATTREPTSSDADEKVVKVLVTLGKRVVSCTQREVRRGGYGYVMTEEERRSNRMPPVISRAVERLLRDHCKQEQADYLLICINAPHQTVAEATASCRSDVRLFAFSSVFFRGEGPDGSVLGPGR